MEEGAAPEEVAAPEVAEVAAPAIDAGSVDDFTEDLLDALAADESPWETEQKPVLVGMDNPEESLEALPSYGNSLTVDEMRAKYKMHDGDTGSAQARPDAPPSRPRAACRPHARRRHRRRRRLGLLALLLAPRLGRRAAAARCLLARSRGHHPA